MCVSDLDQTRYNLVNMPGITNSQVTDHLLDTVEERADALAIVDIPDAYTRIQKSQLVLRLVVTLRLTRLPMPFSGVTVIIATVLPKLSGFLSKDLISNRTLWAPPSIDALDALSTTDCKEAPWFAPAGFTRGGLIEGAGGIPILDVTRRYSSDDRDNLYEANINPIAKIPAECIVSFGLTTLQHTRSALASYQ